MVEPVFGEASTVHDSTARGRPTSYTIPAPCRRPYHLRNPLAAFIFQVLITSAMGEWIRAHQPEIGFRRPAPAVRNVNRILGTQRHTNVAATLVRKSFAYLNSRCVGANVTSVGLAALFQGLRRSCIDQHRWPRS